MTVTWDVALRSLVESGRLSGVLTDSIIRAITLMMETIGTPDLIQSPLFFNLCSQFLILQFLISPYTQSHHLGLGLPLGRLPSG
jgi:hypothetical protein